ncbi:MAG TPA: hypothetical protein PKD51_11405 [Saprospiraceae bacterium]|nr:hypothetical protein [Saprospiraceae bacterium]
MKLISTFIIFLVLANFGLAQDIITKTDGVKVLCTITKEDSLNYYILTKIKGKEINTFIPKTKVQEANYGSPSTQKLINTKDIIEIHEAGNVSSSGINLTRNELKSLLSTYPPAMEKYSQGQGIAALSNGFGAVGGFLVGYELGGQISGGEFNSTRFAVGGGLTILSIIMGANANRSKKKAIEIYNDAHKNKKGMGHYEKPKVSFSISGLVVNF